MCQSMGGEDRDWRITKKKGLAVKECDTFKAAQEIQYDYRWGSEWLKLSRERPSGAPLRNWASS